MIIGIIFLSSPLSWWASSLILPFINLSVSQPRPLDGFQDHKATSCEWLVTGEVMEGERTSILGGAEVFSLWVACSIYFRKKIASTSCKLNFRVLLLWSVSRRFLSVSLSPFTFLPLCLRWHFYHHFCL